MITQTPEKFNDAVEHLTTAVADSESRRFVNCLVTTESIQTLISAYQAEKERLDWLLGSKNVGIKLWYNERWNFPAFDFETIDRATIDSLRNQKDKQ